MKPSDPYKKRTRKVVITFPRRNIAPRYGINSSSNPGYLAPKEVIDKIKGKRATTPKRIKPRTKKIRNR